MCRKAYPIVSVLFVSVNDSYLFIIELAGHDNLTVNIWMDFDNSSTIFI